MTTATPTAPTAAPPTARTPWLRASGLTKDYGAFRRADVSLEAAPGRVRGFFGPNGSGKTTTLSILAGLVRPDSGTVRLDTAASGLPGREPMAVLLDSFGYNPFLSGRDHLRTVARRFGRDRDRVGEVLESVGLASAARRRIGAYSLGMRRRLGLAEVLLVDADVVLLDEPTNGLDPDGIAWFRRTMRRMAADGRAVILSSHLLGEAEGLIDDATFLVDGRVAWSGSYTELLGSFAGTFSLLTGPRAFELAEALAERGIDVHQSGPAELAVRAEDLRAVQEMAVVCGIDAAVAESGRPSLDLVYHLIRSGKLAEKEASSHE